MSDDTPTERFTAPTAPVPTAAEEPPSRTLLYVLIGVGAALLIAIIIIVLMLVHRDSGEPQPTTTTSSSPSASPTPTITSPSPTPTAEETEEAPPPAPPAPADPGPIKSFSVDDTSVDCSGMASVPMHFSWNTTGQTLWFGVGTNNAKNAPFDTFPLVHELDFDYQCGQSSGQQTYTITVEQSNGDLLSKTITITE